jgi:hypothetical protein
MTSTATSENSIRSIEDSSCEDFRSNISSTPSSQCGKDETTEPKGKDDGNAASISAISYLNTASRPRSSFIANYAPSPSTAGISSTDRLRLGSAEGDGPLFSPGVPREAVSVMSIPRAPPPLAASSGATTGAQLRRSFSQARSERNNSSSDNNNAFDSLW